MTKRSSYLRHSARARLWDERGGVGFAAIAVCFVMVLLIPFLWDVASVHYGRRRSNAAADSAALAAAQEYARKLQHTMQWNDMFRGKCELGEYVPQLVVLRYLMEPAFTGAPAFGQGYAAEYAGRNGADLTSYRSWPHHAGKTVQGVPIPWIKVRTEVQRPVHTAYRPIYGREFEVPNQALAVAFLDRWYMIPRPCGADGRVTYDFTFEWKITLDNSEAGF
jgi:TM2 domain-containing membrane protein YozV